MEMFDIIDLNREQTDIIEEKLDMYDEEHIKYKLTGNVSIGIIENGELIAGANGCITAFKIFYVSTVFVDERYRNKGIGRRLIETIEKRAELLGANIIRLDTFNFQGADFYRKLGYEEVGFYEIEDDGFSESFFLKRLKIK